MVTTPSPNSASRNMSTSSPHWKKLAMAGCVAAGAAVGLAAGDNYFEIGKNLEIFNELYKELNVYYVDETDPGQLMTTGIDAMLESLDPYTQYIAESEMEDYRIMTTGQYGGIGAMIRRKGDEVLISEPYENCPAVKSGIQAGDLIAILQSGAYGASDSPGGFLSHAVAKEVLVENGAFEMIGR